MRIKALALGLMTGTIVAQPPQIPIPPFTSTYSHTDQTRGFYFQAPSALFISGVRVPDETQNGIQNVEVVRLSGDPATGNATVAASLFYATNQPSANVLQCFALFSQGDWIGILGACGTSTMHNSYGAGGYASSVNGHPITLNRLMFQSNLNAFSSIGQPVFTVAFSLGRVEVYPGSLLSVASWSPSGAGCLDRASASFYELFPSGAFDLSNTTLRFTQTANGYSVMPVASQWYVPTSTPLTLADDSVSAALPLGFTLSYPGGSTTNLYVSSNGFVWAQNNTNSGCCNGTVADLLQQGARWSSLWNDLDPSSGGAVHFDTDPGNNAAYVTFDQVVESGTANANTFQVAFFAAGTVEYRFGSCTVANHQVLTGWSPGANQQDPGNTDISAAAMITTEPDLVAITHTASARPVLGTTIYLETANVPAGAAIGATVFGLTKFLPGIDLTPFGMGGCYQYASTDAIRSWVPVGGIGSSPFVLPFNWSLNGLPVNTQGVCLAPGTTTLGVITSNGVDLSIGTH